MTNEKREQITNHILQQVDRKGTIDVQMLIETFGVSKSTVYNYITKLKDEGEIHVNGDRLSLKCTIQPTFMHYDNIGLDEAEIFQQDIYPHIRMLPENVVKIWRYAFSEIMNNAIEHSRSDKIEVYIVGNKIRTIVRIRDEGIGVFENIRLYSMKNGVNLTYEECLSVLLPGKFTTNSDNHSGEGIFFTSRMLDYFAIRANKMKYVRTEFNELTTDAEQADAGTTVYMNLSNNTVKTAKDVFDFYADPDEGFYKTDIPLRYMFPSKEPVARSEARRLGSCVEDFSEVILDFTEIEFVGQAFVHELFIVWQRNHPDIKLVVENACEDVERMIKRVKNTR